MNAEKQKVALVIGSLPSIEEIDQFSLLSSTFDVSVISSESICGYLTENSFFQDLNCIALKDHDDNPTFLPGLEQALANFDVVVVKERLGLYSYQALKAKWRYQFRLLVWIDNLNPFPAEDVDQMRTIRQEVCHTADGFLVQSKLARSMLEMEGIEKDRIHDLKPWLATHVTRSPAARAEARSRLGLPESSLIISYMGQIEWEEGLKDLIVAAKILIDKEPSLKDRLRLVICGIGAYGSELSSIFQAFNIENCVAYYAPSRDANKAILQASDAIYLSTLPSRDRVEGDPFRILVPMAYGIPLLASRTPMMEEFCGKHRLDFCLSSSQSLAKAIRKLKTAPALIHNIVSKNQTEFAKRYEKKTAQKQMLSVFQQFAEQEASVAEGCLDHQVLEVEAKIKAQQYVDAIDIIESIFRLDDVPLHHRANLFRLIGDCFVKLGDMDAAKNAYVQGGELDPYSAKVFIGLGTIGLMKNTTDVAVLHFQKAVSLAPDDEMANLGLGLSFQAMGELKEANRWVAKALQLNASNTAAIFTFVKLSHELGEFEECEAVLRRFLRTNPNDHNIMYSLGGIIFKLQRFDEVINLMELILATEPEDDRARQLLNHAKKAQEETTASSSNG
ncbi:MAG: glycosyltransferase [Oligoflexus sp.]